ncbi:hypothetical protein PAECIP111893_02498 [Paenibacillus plantiphilus]|uniref:Uncharacterized protein n=1 Tax=Paenibacillus plantiphilus TaxID=2905650 RepID=A0ABM9C9X6_9BACL|nr:hypothetical protein [Paenibacillus plantiphilus]CAH1206273.1 hypothetical protein PAECIP111893_02498 [Paenibacillus plantiphilus]
MKDRGTIHAGSDSKPEPELGDASVLESASKASVKSRRGRPPGSLKSREELAHGEESLPNDKIGPADAAPHWQEFYRSIRDAVAGMRSK